MDTGKQILEAERRKARASGLKIVVDHGDKTFMVLTDHSVKYRGFVGRVNYCGCKSFEFGNTDIYFAEHGTYFECKHIIAAKKMIESNITISYPSDKRPHTKPKERLKVF